MPPGRGATDPVPPRLVVCRGDDPGALVREALSDPGLTGVLDGDSAVPRGTVVVLARLSPPTPVTAQVLEAVVDALADRAVARVVIAATLTDVDRDRGYDDVHSLARAAGLTGVTARGASYELADLRAETLSAPVTEVAVLHGRQLSRLWSEAAVRLLLARSVTDLLDGYAGCLDTLLSVADPVYGADAGDVASELLDAAPPDLVLVDATVSSDGPDGARLLREVATDTLLVGTDALLADAVLAGLQGQDRSSSRLVAQALRARGEPAGEVSGDLSRFTSLERPHPLCRAAARAVARDPVLARALLAAVGHDPEVSEDPVLGAAATLLQPLVAAAGTPAGRAALAEVLGLAGLGTGQVRGWSSVLAKGRVRRRVVPLGFDHHAVPLAEYDGLPEELDAVLAGVRGLPANPDGMRWCEVDGATVFEVARDLEVSFADFVARVDVAEGISLMADYLGGRRVVLGAGPAGTRQAERNLYLPQPNYLALWSAPPIDVCKIELVRRDDGEHRLHWRTVLSPNGSTVHDDGVLTFTESSAGRTRVTVSGRQLFTLPPVWQLLDLSSLPEVREPLLEEAYRRFFTGTFDNLEACVEGRGFRIGREPPSGYEPLPTRALSQLLDAVTSWRSPGADGLEATGAEVVDIHGFRHFRNAP